MEITDVQTARLGMKSAVVRIETDAGVTGYGEGVVEAMPGAVQSVVERFGEEYLVGADPRPVERHRRVMQDALWYHHGKVANGAMTGIENALLDIKGKHLGVPVYELLGGPVREEVRVYKWLSNSSRERLLDDAAERVAAGYDAMKFTPLPPDPSSYPQVVEEVRETVAAVREAVGPDVDLMLDPASRFKLAEARHVLAEVEAYDPLFAEDFIPPDHVPAVEKLADSTTIPIALGDRLTRYREFEPLIQRDAAAILQPDIAHSGGLLELKRIAGAAEHHGIRIAPHNPQGPLATAAAVHLALSVPNFLIQEITEGGIGQGEAAEFVDADVLTVEGGRIAAPDRPGLGVEVDDRVFEADFEDVADLRDPPLYVDSGDDHVADW